jgi:hypothetical protein
MYHNPDDTKSGDCLKNYFEDVLLIIVFHYPFYDSIPLLKSFYNDVFKDILICGPEAYFHHFVMVVDVGPGLYGYECAGAAIRKYVNVGMHNFAQYLLGKEVLGANMCKILEDQS